MKFNNKKNENENIDDSKVESIAKINRKDYLKMYLFVFWGFVSFLSLVFGSSAIVDAVFKINDIISYIDEGESAGRIILTIFNSIRFILEAFMFGFFLIYSGIKTYKNFIVFMEKWNHIKVLKYSEKNNIDLDEYSEKAVIAMINKEKAKMRAEKAKKKAEKSKSKNNN